MTAIVSTLAEIAPRYRALFCDLWGCVHDGVRAFAPAVAALETFRAGGGRVILVTNAPRPRAAVVAQLDRLGVARAAWDDVATSGEAAQQAMLDGAAGRRVFHIGPPKDDAFFTDFAGDLADFAAARPPVLRVPLEEAEGIVCTGPFDEMTETAADYRATFLRARAMDLPMICANPDLVVDLGDRRIPCAGALARLYEEMGGRVLSFGKPHPPIYDLARRRLAALDPAAGENDILCVGDGIGTDIRGGAGEGLDTLFVTGGIAAAAFAPDPDRPRPEALAAFAAAEGVEPTFAIGRLR